MTTLRVKHIDAFTNSPFAGNPAGVVLNAEGLRDDLMQRIAREMNLSETAFVLPPNRPEADIRIRWFTPTHEVPLCGHATVAAFHALAQEGLAGMKTNGQHYFRVETGSGVLAVKVEKNFRGIGVEFQLPLPAFRIKRALPVILFQLLGIRRSDVAPGLPVVTDRDLYLPVKRLQVLQTMRPHFQELVRWCTRARLTGVCVFTLQARDKSGSVHSRFFAPAVGINEDPVTGSANGPLGVYLKTFAGKAGYEVPCRLLPDGRVEYVGEQGDEIERPGRVKIRLRMQDDRVEDVSIAGEAVTVWSAAIQL